jgi:hypothetical protein
MNYVRYRVSKLSREQKDVVDCHHITKNRYLHTGEEDCYTELANYKKCSNLEVLPREESFTHTRYFATDYPCNQLWERPIQYHYLGRVYFLSTTTYCDQDTKSLLSTAGYTTKPVIYHRFKDRKGSTKPVSLALLSEIVKEQREDRKRRHALDIVVAAAYRNQYQEDTDSTAESETSQSDMDESPAVVEQTVSDTESAEDNKPSATEPVSQPFENPDPVNSQVRPTEPGDYVTQDEETYKHYYKTTEKKIKIEEKSDTEAEV